MKNGFSATKNWLAIGILAFGMILAGSTPTWADADDGPFPGAFSIIDSKSTNSVGLSGAEGVTFDGVLLSWVLKDTSETATDGNLTFVWQFLYSDAVANTANIFGSNGESHDLGVGRVAPGGVSLPDSTVISSFKPFSISTGEFNCSSVSSTASTSIGNGPKLVDCKTLNEATGLAGGPGILTGGLEPSRAGTSAASPTTDTGSHTPGPAFATNTNPIFNFVKCIEPATGDTACNTEAETIAWGAGDTSTNHSWLLYAVTNAREYTLGHVTLLDGGLAGDAASFAPSTIPEPATLTMLGSGLLGIVGYIRKKRQA
jgi:hypothetical protein